VTAVTRSVEGSGNVRVMTTTESGAKDIDPHVDLDVEEIMQRDIGAAHYGGFRPAGTYWAMFDQLREEAPFSHSTDGPQGYWLFTRHEAVLQGRQSPNLFSASSLVHYEPDPPYQWIPVMLDPPEHAKYRQLLSAHFSPGTIERMAGRVQQRCREILDGLAARTSCDFVQDFARIYPTTIFMELMGLPVSEAPRFMAWEALILHGNPETDPDRSKAYQAMLDVQDYFRVLAARRRAEPADDLVSHLVQCTIDGVPLSEEDLLSTCLLMFMAGLDTVTAQLSYTFWHLATHPDDRRRIVEDPAIIPSALEEFLRYYAIVNTGARATQDVVFQGCPVKQGDMVLFPFASACRDERSFDHALEFDIERTPNHHIAFGAGPHRCVGSHLARRELRVALEEWHQRIPDYRLAEGAELIEHGGGVMGLENLPLVWD
jgi:cytochrome P450